MSAAFASVMRPRFEVQAGLLMRQVHHWTALVFLGAIAVHLARIFFTGAFRRPREINWLIGLGCCCSRWARGSPATRCPDDLLSGTGLRIIYSVDAVDPVRRPVGRVAVLRRRVPDAATSSAACSSFHVLLLPGLLIGGIGAHLGLVCLQKHTQYRRPRPHEDNVVGLPFWPAQVFRSTGLFFLTAAVVTLIAGLFQINPVWLYGPFVPYVATVAGAARLVRRLARGRAAHRAADRADHPRRHDPVAVRARRLIPGLLFTIAGLWPFIEARADPRPREHHLLDSPWQTPIRTATGAAGVALFLVLTLAGGNDVLATLIAVPVEGLTRCSGCC